MEIKDLVTVALECDRQKWLMDGESVEDIAKEVQDTLMSKSKMLEDYFSFKINEKGQLVSIPFLLGGFFNIISIPFVRFPTSSMSLSFTNLFYR
jgi:hypothetical protein